MSVVKLIVAPFGDGAGPLNANDTVALAPFATVVGLIVKEVSVGRMTAGGVTVKLALWLVPL